MKNTRKVVVVLGLLLCMTAGNVFAAPAANGPGDGIAPYFVSIDTISSSLSIDGNGKATCSSTMIGYINSCTSSSLTVELQYLSGGDWVTRDSWTAYGDFMVDSYETRYVPRGYTYRLKATATAYYNGAYVEQAVCNSNVVNY